MGSRSYASVQGTTGPIQCIARRIRVPIDFAVIKVMILIEIHICLTVCSTYAAVSLNTDCHLECDKIIIINSPEEVVVVGNKK